MPFLAAAVQFEPRWGRKEPNLSRLLELTREAADEGAKLVVWPEMAATGYVFADRAEIRPFCEPVPGPTTDAVAELCRARGIHVALGLAEVDPATDVFYNAAVLVDDLGRVVGRYRKTHLWCEDTRWAAPGGEVAAWDTSLGRIGLLICRDADFPEAGRLVAEAGAEVVCHLTNWLGPAPARAWRARAAENGVYWIATNRWGEERGARFSGGTSVIGPDGAVLDVRAEGDGFALAAVDPARVRARRRSGDLAWEGMAKLAPELALNPFLYPEPRRERPDALVAVVQAGPTGAGPDEVRARCEPHLAALAAWPEPPALVVLPALVDPDDARGAREVAAWAEPLPGPSSDWLLDWARRLKTRLVTALLEWSEGDVYLTVVMVDADGVVARHRATRAAGAAPAWLTPGEGFHHVDLPFGRVGLLFGPELLPPEPLRLLALRGARIVAAPAGAFAPSWLWPQRAVENELFLAVAAREATGGSFVYGDRREEERRAPLAEAGVHAYRVPGYVPWVDERTLLRMRPAHLYTALASRRAGREEPRPLKA
ncbi:MAG: amidohydrolase [Clostridia bacterium]|nr:amidohydrolase [Clostridia bacterium]